MLKLCTVLSKPRISAQLVQGIIKSQLHLGYLKEAEQQIDILAEIQSSTGFNRIKLL